jgi:hypothetical protein
LIKNYYFSDTHNHIEEQYIEPSIESYKWNEWNEVLKEGKIDEEKSGKEITQLIQKHYRAAAPFYFEYVPENFEKLAEWYTLKLATFFQSPKIKKMVHDLKIELHQTLYDVRGKMKNKTVKLFGVPQMKAEEFISVGVHEFSHFVDIYFLEQKVFQDLSEHFYDISWENTRVLKPGQEKFWFVSGYAMTNKYEDFAESFTYYILHNDDFVVKAQESLILKKKYDFFSIFLFKKWEFKETDFSVGNKVRDYYRDITKIDIDLEKLLQYLKNWI